jgi:hypothetical protein
MASPNNPGKLMNMDKPVAQVNNFEVCCSLYKTWLCFRRKIVLKIVLGVNFLPYTFEACNGSFHSVPPAVCGFKRYVEGTVVPLSVPGLQDSKWFYR